MKIVRRIVWGIIVFLVGLYFILIGWAYAPTGIEEVPARTLAGEADQFIVVGELELRYQTFGTPDNDKVTLLLLHGFSNSLQSFRLVAPLLAEDYYVVTLDMPGFGLSSKPADFDYRNENQAVIVSQFVEALQLENVVIGGHSMGGAVALRVAHDNSSIIGLVAMNPGIITTGTPEFVAYLPFPLTRLAAKQFSNRDFREEALKESFVNPDIVTDEVMDNLQLAVRSEGYLAGTTTMMGQYEPASESALMADIDVPVVIVWGEMDFAKPPEELDVLQAGFHNPIMVVVPDVGHYVHEEAPEIVANALIEISDIWQQ